MTENVNRLTERVAKMSDFKRGDIVVAASINGVTNELTIGKDYWVHDTAKGEVMIKCDIGRLAWYYSSRFKLKEKVNSVATEEVLYCQLGSGYIFNLLFKGDTQCVLKRQCDGTEISVHVENLYPPLFRQCTKEDVKTIAKQAKKNEDLGVLANVTDEIRKLLDDNYVICHVQADKTQKGLIEYTMMIGESV